MWNSIKLPLRGNLLYKECAGELMRLINKGSKVQTKIKNGKMLSTENYALKTLARLLRMSQ